MQPIIGNQGYDAVVTGLRTKPASKSYVEITQAHEGENDYLFRLVLANTGFAYGHSPAIKKGIRRNKRVSIPPQVVTPSEVARDELDRIVDAARRKEAKNYPANTSLIIVFDDDLLFRRVMDDTHLDTSIKKNILKLDLRFSTLYLVGWHNVFREFSLATGT